MCVCVCVYLGNATPLYQTALYKYVKILNAQLIKKHAVIKFQ